MGRNILKSRRFWLGIGAALLISGYGLQDYHEYNMYTGHSRRPQVTFFIGVGLMATGAFIGAAAVWKPKQ